MDILVSAGACLLFSIEARFGPLAEERLCLPGKFSAAEPGL